MTTSTAVLPTVVAPVSATRAQSPVITTAATHPADMLQGSVGLGVFYCPCGHMTAGHMTVLVRLHSFNLDAYMGYEV